LRGDIVLFLALVAVVGGAIVVAVVLILGDGGGSSPCDNALPPLGESEISQETFQEEDVALTRIIAAAEAGNLTAVDQEFFGDVHNFTHNVDPPFRDVDEDGAKDLCEAVIRLEEELAFDRRPATIAVEAALVRDRIRDAAKALGYARPGQ
jgi:hypothetical protein